MQNAKRNVMDNTKINREKLLTIVRDNLVKHQNEFKESLVDFAKAMTVIAEKNKRISLKNLKLVKADVNSKLEQPVGYLAAPRSYETEYNRAIRMLELSVDENIVVEQDVFNQLVLDEWSWKQLFVGTSSMYKTFS
jgi:hypothetical protein